MNILVTGAKGFLGKNLTEALKNIINGKDKRFSLSPDTNIFEYDTDSSIEELDKYLKEADFVFNLAGVNRPLKESEFFDGNKDFVSLLIAALEKHNNTCPIVLSSSIQAELDNPYGRSKKAGENLLFEYAKKTGAKVYIYRFPNIFGKWSRPDYNSVVATFCHNISRGLPITVNDEKHVLNLVYIDDAVDELISAMLGRANQEGNFCSVPIVHSVTLGRLSDLLYSFKETRGNLSVPDMSDDFTKKLYATYLSYLPEDKFSYPLKVNGDFRGSFTEIIRTPERGQLSINIIKPGITKGNHWHNTKNEKFLVVSGNGLIRFRKPGSSVVTEYSVSSEKLEVVDIPPGYTHSIVNTGKTDMAVLMWASECFDKENPDTFYLEV